MSWAAVAAVALVAALAAPNLPPHEPASGSEHTERVAGPERVATAVEASRRYWPSSDDVVLATAGAFADALAGGQLAVALDAPLLLTPGDALPDTVASEIERLGAGRAWLLGGSAAISPAVAQRLEQLDLDVRRLEGAERFATARAIASRLAPAGNGEAVVALGGHPDPDRAWPDALAAGALVATGDPVPLVLTRPGSLPSPSEAALRELDASTVRVIGGSAAIGSAVTARLTELGYSTERLAGPTRYQTSLAVAERALERLGDAPVPLVVASGADYPDALTGAAVTARIGGVLLLVPPGDLDPVPEVGAFLAGHGGRFSRVVLLGGEAALSSTVAGQLAAAVDPPDPEPDPDPTDEPDPDPTDEPDPDPTEEPDETPPVITDVGVDADPDGATVTWTTDEPATSSVAYGPTSAYEDGTVEDSSLVTGHEITLSGLDCETTYHYRIASTDEAGNTASTGDATFDTEDCIVSDAFDGEALDGDVWRFVDPEDDSSVEVSGGRARISVPEGERHDLLPAHNQAPRLLQDAPDEDFEIVAKFDSEVDTRTQGQGLLAVQDFDTLVRADVHHDGSETRVFATGMDEDSTSGNLNTAVPDGAPVWLRLARAGDTWTVSYAHDLEDPHDDDEWTEAGSFDFALTVTEVGLYAVIAHTNPAFSAVVDEFLNPDDPLPDPGPDEDPPQITGTSVDARPGDATVTWTTEEPATSSVAYGPTSAYGDEVTGGNLTLEHALTLPGLDCETPYHYEISSTDAAGNTATTDDTTFTTAACAPEIELDYGTAQAFGHVANPQRWITIPGTVVAGDGVDTLTYRLGSGSEQELNVGPDNRRLAGEGDFIVELDRDDLDAGEHEVEITATDVHGQSATETVTVDVADEVETLPFEVAWSELGKLQDRVEPMEGRWRVDGGEARPTRFSYDRLLALGDGTWTDYEVTVPVTVHELDPAGGGYDSPSNGPRVGFGLRWDGYHGSAQPRRDWWPTGAFVTYHWNNDDPDGRFKLAGNENTPRHSDNPRTYTLAEGDTFVFKAQVTTGGDGRPTYRFKAWEHTEDEPADWLLEITGDTDDPGEGAILLVAHEIDASFGDVEVTTPP